MVRRVTYAKITSKHIDFYEKYVVRGQHPDECYGWTGPVSSDGYPRVRPPKESETAAARVSLFALYGEVSEAIAPDVCSVRTCTNPRHLIQKRHRGLSPSFVRSGGFITRPQT